MSNGHKWDPRPDWVDVYEEAGREYFYSRGEIIVDSRDQDRVQEILGRDVENARDLDLAELGLDLWRVPDVQEALRLLREAPGEPIRAAPNHGLVMTNHVKYSPGTEPRPAERLSRPRTEWDRSVAVGVIDTGVWAEHPWFDGAASGDPEQPADDGTYAGHGTFVAGVVLQHAPGASVVVCRPNSSTAGWASDRDAAICLFRLLDGRRDIDIVNLSLGGYTHDNSGLPALTKAIEVALERRAERRRSGSGELVVVAAAGNDDTRREFYPAAMPRVTAVGAIDRAGVRPTKDWQARPGYGNWGSNYGWWVDAHAIGVEVHSTFLEGLLPQGGHPAGTRPQTFERYAHWDGTSFSAPAVAGAIADLAARSGMPAAQAAFQLLQPSITSPRVPELGVRVQVPIYV